MRLLLILLFLSHFSLDIVRAECWSVNTNDVVAPVEAICIGDPATGPIDAEILVESALGDPGAQRVDDRPANQDLTPPPPKTKSLTEEEIGYLELETFETMYVADPTPALEAAKKAKEASSKVILPPLQYPGEGRLEFRPMTFPGEYKINIKVKNHGAEKRVKFLLDLMTSSGEEIQSFPPFEESFAEGEAKTISKGLPGLPDLRSSEWRIESYRHDPAHYKEWIRLRLKR